MGIAPRKVAEPPLKLGVLVLGCALPFATRAQTPQDALHGSRGMPVGAVLLAPQAMAAYQEGTREGVERSIQLWTQVADLLDGAEDRWDEGAILYNIGIAYKRLWRPESALAYYHRALKVEMSVPDSVGEDRTLQAIGRVHADLGRPDSALWYYRKGLQIAKAMHDSAGEGSALDQIGQVQSDLGRPDWALVYYGLALKVTRAVQDSATTLHNIAGVYRARGRSDSALAYYQKALTTERSASDSVGEGRTLNAIGLEHDFEGRFEMALEYYRQALTIQRARGDSAGEGVTFSNLGWLFHHGTSLMDLALATAYYDSAAAVRARMGAHVGGDANRVSYAELQVPLFEAWPLAWLARGGEVGAGPSALAALAASERGRTQALLDLMRESSVGLPAKPGQDLSAEGARLLGSVGATGAAVLAYLVTRDTLLVWFALPSGRVELTRHAIARDSLAQLVQALRHGLGADEAVTQSRVAVREAPALEASRANRSVPVRARTRRPASVSAVAGALATLLVPPDLAQRLGPRGELVIVPQGPLASVPFAVLSEDTARGPLGLRYALRYAPSLATLEEAEHQGGLPSTAADRVAALRSALVVGNPRMPAGLRPLAGAEAEARWVGTRLGVRPLVGDSAAEATVRRRLGRAAVVHLATHGVAYAAEGARASFVALGPGAGEDGLLTVGELVDDPSLRLSADVVVLSACQTGLGDVKQAEGTVGLQRAFLAKGARSVLVSLWSVNDQATAALMQQFYGHWLGDPGRPSKAEALRRAQADVRRMPGFAEPRFWAPFQLVGAR